MKVTNFLEGPMRKVIVILLCSQESGVPMFLATSSTN